ncbi:hypothetical protein ACFQ60_22790 [Streptomyces zhihengii]
MVRNVIGSVLALTGATAAVWSPFRDWYDGRPGRDYRVQDLFDGITGAGSGIAASVMLPLAFGALIALIGVVLRSRLLVALAGLIVLGFTVLWMVRQGQAAGSLTVSTDGRGLGDGVAMAAGGGVLMLIGAAVMSGGPGSGCTSRTRRRPRRRTTGGPTAPIPPAPCRTGRTPTTCGPTTRRDRTARRDRTRRNRTATRGVVVTRAPTAMATGPTGRRRCPRRTSGTSGDRALLG